MMCGAPRCGRRAKLVASVPSAERYCCLRHIRWALASLADWPIQVRPAGDITAAELAGHGTVRGVSR